MAIRPKTQLGTMPCLCCSREVPVKAGLSGTLNFSCSWCDFPGYAKAGTEARDIIAKRMTPTEARTEVPTVPPVVIPKKPATVFG